MIRFVKHFFSSLIFSKNDLRGSVFLLFVLWGLIFIPLIIKKFTSDEIEFNSSDIDKLDSLERRLILKQITVDDSAFVIDPNKLSYRDWLDLGATSFQAKGLVALKKKLGSFTCLDQITDIQGIKNSLVSDYFIYFNIPKACKSVINFSIELNHCTVSDLRRLGISTRLARRVLSFRNALGGYYSIDQLREVYELSDDDYQQILKAIEIDKSVLKKIKVNQCSYTQLKKHPYISKKIANKIVNYRKKIGKFTSEKTLANVHGLNKENLMRLLPYISFE